MKILKKEAKSFEQKDIHRVICRALIDVLHCKQREFEKKCQGAAAFADVTYRKAKFNLENYDVCQNAVLTAFGPVMTSNMGTIIAVILCLLLGAVGATIAFYVYRYRPNSFSSFTALLPFNNS
ncbi:unnamed protein product, partial [Mesorhabditis belari]|uniref:Uncharacterized protein n=1 Tax=Mesorhabditis belari TaxID=2138241 RepID=A0AAF3EBB4_9BILA